MSTAAAPQAAKPLTVGPFSIDVIGDLKGFTLHHSVRNISPDGVDVLDLTLASPQPQAPPRFTLKWRIPSHDVAGHWMTSRGQSKTIRPDWTAGRLQASMFAREAPVSTLFSSTNRNVLTFAVSDALNTISVGSGVREEDGFIYNEIVFFAERHRALTGYEVSIRIDRRPLPYEAALRDVSAWWASLPGYEPAPAPAPARLPVYSTWYNFHQSVDSAVLLEELEVAKKLGFESIIVDDGWQTMDTSRGYAFTGDWKPERMPEMRAFVDASHKIGINVLLWYAVAFVGKSAAVATRFRDKSLRFDERLGAYVLDPRYPEVRAYLIGLYTDAMKEWDLDGFKLDFMERFVADDQTVLEAAGGRDYASVNDGAHRLMTDVMRALRAIKPDVMIEFRQAYIGPLMRTYGNMFRASDSPNAYLANRVKVVDLRLLSGPTVVHGDMVMWHKDEPVERAALQLHNILFSVPQISVKLGESSPAHLEMIKFYLDYWKANASLLLEAPIEAPSPTANYPMVSVRSGDKQIVALYNDVVVEFDGRAPLREIDIINAKGSERVVLTLPKAGATYHAEIRDCRGRLVRTAAVSAPQGLAELHIPVSGIVSLRRVGP
jgi:alpha-galactosidase